MRVKSSCDRLQTGIIGVSTLNPRICTYLPISVFLGQENGRVRSAGSKGYGPQTLPKIWPTESREDSPVNLYLKIVFLNFLRIILLNIIKVLIIKNKT